MESFTPGPWYAHGNGVWRADTHNSVAFVTVHKPDLRDSEECAATARLIAHAPEMYAAMKEFCERGGNGATRWAFKSILDKIINHY